MTKHLKLGIAGLGTVGTGLIRLIAAHHDRLREATGKSVTVAAVSARDRSRDRGVDISSAQWFDNAVTLAQSEAIDVFVELIGGDEGIARDAVTAALQAGKHVVTANKALLAKHGAELAAMAEERNVTLAFEAAVAGGIPVIKTMREALAGNAVTRVYG
ncbi:MAG: homoserine dehydrogenase, partial [Pseudomonadota bacterium]